MAFKNALGRLTLLSLLVSVGSFVPAGCSSPSPPSSPSRPSFDLRLCALVSGCASYVDTGVGSLCANLQNDSNWASEWESGFFLTAESRHCLSGATTCGEVDACVRNTPAEIAACNGKSTDQCVGDVDVGCTGTPPFYFFDCAQDGLHCFQGASNAGCGTGTCDPSATPPSCQGDVLVSCTNIGAAAEPSGVLSRTDCSKQFGWTANDAESESCSSAGCTSAYADTCGVVRGVAQCMGSGAACDPSTFRASCSGTVVSACTGGKVAQFDCASLGPLTCKDSDPPGLPTCVVSAGTECVQAEQPETCEDGVITFCLAGWKATMDCKSYGFSGCTTAMPAETAVMAAKCTP